MSLTTQPIDSPPRPSLLSNTRRSKRRLLRNSLSAWRAQAGANSTLRAAALARLSSAAKTTLQEAFSRWRARTGAAAAAQTALSALSRVSNRRRSDRAEMRLALRTWRYRAGLGDVEGESGGREGRGGGDGGGGDGRGLLLEVVAGVSQEAASAFAMVTSVRGLGWAGGARVQGVAIAKSFCHNIFSVRVHLIFL